jgi:hypothetical protein
MPKCASSSLQQYFSSNQFSIDASDRIIYAAVNGDGDVISGEDLYREARRNSHGYVSSCSSDILASFDNKKSKTIREKLIKIARDGKAILLSNEEWGGSPIIFGRNNVFNDDKFNVSIYCYIRPQVEFMNSAWWQWGAWTGSPFNSWIIKNLKLANWSELLNSWSSISWIRSLHAFPLRPDVIKHFSNQLGFESKQDTHTNKNLPLRVLRFLQRHRDLRASPHDSEIDFILGRQPELLTGNSAWVITEILAKEIIKKSTPENLKLITFLHPKDWDLILLNPRWWSPEEYQKIDKVLPSFGRFNPHEVDKFLFDAIKAIIRLDQENRELHSSLQSYTREN